MRYYKPIEIARALNISTSALRHYESWDIVPIPERGENGYRLYTHVHLAYFRCLRALFAGFGVSVASQVLRLLRDSDLDAALWLVNREQAQLHHEKQVADQTLALLRDPELPLAPNKKLKSRMSIGEVAALTDVQASAIRHWEKEGLLRPDRDPENGYRLFTPTHVRQILLIRTLRRTVYFLDRMKEIVQSVDHHSFEKARKVYEDALLSIHERNRRQYEGAYQMVELCRTIGLWQRPPVC
ncbi:TioE family transcriptional regulator [Cohnella nanjingensis]|uniref:MerR family transcriptional regulator n=1 Tax=Cohnella nanjingensis TaxID=1387779 RepID=A0A7X0RKD8_9BACL|nr:TioE family transcriptional regulator [Cohnella nanjingensis]MBB6669092.1 MerR family transcriptional regulator [Cohnella nanjingensis]